MQHSHSVSSYIELLPLECKQNPEKLHLKLLISEYLISFPVFKFNACVIYTYYAGALQIT